MAYSSGCRIISQQYGSLSFVSACVPAQEKRLCPFTKLFQTVCSVCLTIQTQFISRSSRGFRFHFNFLFFFFFFFFLCARHSAWLSGSEIHCSGILREEKRGHCLWRRTKTFGIAVTPSLNTQFSDLAGSTVNGQLSCLIQQRERWLGVQGQAPDTGMQAKFN